MGAVRAGMADLITQVRGYIGDPAGDAAEFTDEEVQRALDAYRIGADLEPLVGRRTAPTLTSYTVHEHPALADWEATPTAYVGNLEVELDLEATDLAAGVFVTATGQTGTVYVTGYSYDPASSAGELLEEWAARVARRHDFTADGATHRRSQQREGLLELARTYRARARVVSVPNERRDLRGCG